MTTRHAVFVSAFALTCLPAAAMAQTQSVTLEQAVAKLAALQAQLEAVQAEVAALRAQGVQQQAAATPPSTPPAAPADPIKVSWKGAPEVSSKGWSFKPRGRLQFDAARISRPAGVADTGLGFSNELRRAYLGVQGTMPGGFGYRIDIDFAPSSPEFQEAFIDYTHGRTTITAGQHNGFQGLEELTSDVNTSFMERAAFTDAFGFERRLGISAQYRGDVLLLQGGVFTDNIADLSDDANNSYGFDGRIVFSPKMGGANLHLGASAHYRDTGGTGAGTRYRQRPQLHPTDVRFLATPALQVTSETSYGLELATVAGPFHAAAEAHWMRVSVAGAADPTFFGGYIEGGWLLTGESRGYRDGAFDRIKPANPVSDGGIGAFALNVRYDYLDLSDAGIIGGRQQGFLAALIWKPTDYVLFALNGGRLLFDDAALAGTGGDRDYGATVVGLRSQIDF
ncbi:OprO/OprP family phosphate-selective porin [Sphingosinicella soli]|uniref:Phosphate-selective porin OprO/OprP n=1 Tax=Sphingosinicella soli TaxID=333708 RepID=A0A7W7FAD2_9SPHN|nr:porin [Sphingosinicella soli]MBB4633563.1 phosphate-selective porin OprO/OprP [Sphingosinicella soli]